MSDCFEIWTVSNISLKLGTVKWKLNRQLCPHKQFFLHFQVFLLLVAFGTLKGLFSVWSVTQTRDSSIFLFQRWGIFKIFEGNKKENEKRNQNNFDVIDFTESVWKRNRKKRRKSLCVCILNLSGFTFQVLFVCLFLCETNNLSCSTIIATFFWNMNFNFQIVLMISLSYF